MKFLYVVGDPAIRLTDKTGYTRHITECIHSLQTLGHEVRLITSSEGGDVAQHKKMLGRARKFMPSLAGAILKDAGKLVYDRRFEQRIESEACSFRPDVIYDRHAPFHRAAVLVGRKLDVPVLLEVNASIKETSRYYGMGLGSIAARIERYVFQAATAILVVSDPLKDELVEYGVPAEKVFANPNGVDPDKFSPAVDSSEVRRNYGLEGKTVVGFLGSLAVWHGVNDLLRAAKVAGEQYPDLRVLVVGSGDEYDNLVRLAAELGISDKVVFTGAVPLEEVPKYINCMDIATALYSDPRQVYGSSTKFYEYMASGRAIIGSNVAQMGSVIEDGVTGLLVVPGDADDLMKKLLHLLGRPELRESMGDRARETAMANHTWVQNARRIVDVCEKIIR